MDVLLINTPISASKRDPNAEESVPPIGMGYIYTQLLLSDCSCRFADAAVQGLLPGDVVKLIDGSDANYVGLNVFSSNLVIVRHIVENVKSPRRFLLGGPAVHALVPELQTWSPNGLLTVIAGDAEFIVPHIVRHGDLPEGGRFKVIRVTPGSAFYPSDIDLPLDRSIFENEPVHRADLGLTEAHVIASRGCLYDCAFCTAAASRATGSPRYRSFECLSTEIEGILKLHPETDCIRVLDDLFLRDKARIELATKLFRQFRVGWRSMAHINAFQSLDAAQLDQIRDSGCRELFIGLESGNDETLAHIRKPFSAATAFATVCRLLDAGVPVKCYFILGFPGETENQMKDTVDMASRLDSHAIQTRTPFRVSPFRFRPYHGTMLFDELLADGKTIAPITNRTDVSGDAMFNPYDCTSGVYANCTQATLDDCMFKLEAFVKSRLKGSQAQPYRNFRQ